MLSCEQGLWVIVIDETRYNKSHINSNKNLKKYTSPLFALYYFFVKYFSGEQKTFAMDYFKNPQTLVLLSELPCTNVNVHGTQQI